ncbi:UNVERIFIED_CONTAM: F-box/kelch-repeat protein [Sesamum radiatum]|uniref:F-box/kelch-repeat protein n=1 Tax=Sesamum radiatum TaxID=300843 RepID=A0AAW2Q2Q8_SESRA
MSSQRVRGELIDRDLESLSASKRFFRRLSQKLKRKNNGNESYADNEMTGVSLRCLTLYGRGGGCKVGADTGEEIGDTESRRRSSSSKDGKGCTIVSGNEEATVDCFSYNVKEKLWRRNSRRVLKFQEPQKNNSMNTHLPDDILEMCLVRLPLRTLMNARLVCKKWRNLTTTPRFMQMRREGSFQSPWLFLFGVVKDGYCSGEIHALDVSLNQWHKIDSEALKGRFMFSVASTKDDVYIVGGCSSLTNSGRVDRSYFKTHKETFFYRSRVAGASDVYEDPHRLSVRRQSRHSIDENNSSLFADTKPYKSAGQKNGSSYSKDGKRFIIIAVGGLGSWDEPLDSGEIYDPMSNKWTEIQRLPLDFGVACSGVVCNGAFYVYSESDKLAGYDIKTGHWEDSNHSMSTPCA